MQQKKNKIQTKKQILKFFLVVELMKSRLDEAFINEIPRYMETFYDENIENKLLGSRKILALFMQVHHYQDLLNHETLIGAMSRTLKDDFKKNVDLAIYFLCSFYLVSQYKEFTVIISENQIGDSCMKIFEYYLNKFDQSMNEFIIKQRQYSELQKTNSVEANKLKNELDKMVKKLNVFIFKQDKLFFIVIKILRNVAEDLSIERKMKKRNIIHYLSRMLERKHIDLITITLNFLKKLSIISENKDQMISENIVKKLKRFLDLKNPDNKKEIVQLSMRLLSNLCFDQNARKLVVQEGLIPNIIIFLKEKSYRSNAIILLSLISLEQIGRKTMGTQECAYFVYQLIINFPENIVGRELMALALNLATVKVCGEFFIGNGQIDLLLQRYSKTKDLMLLKFVRNSVTASSREVVDATLLGHYKTLADAFMNPKVGDDHKFEFLGLLTLCELKNEWANITNDKMIFALQKILASRDASDQSKLEVILLINQIVQNKEAAQQLSTQSKIFETLQIMLLEKSNDLEITFQILRVITNCLISQIGTEFWFTKTNFIDVALTLYGSRNPIMNKLLEDLFDLVIEYDARAAERIKTKKFRLFNKEWCEKIAAMDYAVMKSIGQENNPTAGQYEYEEDNPAQEQIFLSSSDDEYLMN